MKRKRERGVSVIAAIFLITGLALLGTLMTRMISTGSTQVINEWLSAQALYSAESGIHWAAYNIANGSSGSVTDAVVVADRGFFSTTVSAPLVFGPRSIYTITSVGTSGTSAATPLVQRTLEVQFAD